MVKFELIRQPQDGNCFFHSVSFLLNYHKIYKLSQADLRSILSRHYLKKNNPRQKTIKKDSVWAETEDVITLSNLLNVNIKIWEDENKMWVTFGRDYKKSVYLRNIGNVHFDALIKRNE